MIFYKKYVRFWKRNKVLQEINYRHCYWTAIGKFRTRRCMVLSQHRETQLQIESGCFFFNYLYIFWYFNKFTCYRTQKSSQKSNKNSYLFIFTIIFKKEKKCFRNLELPNFKLKFPKYTYIERGGSPHNPHRDASEYS